MTRREKTLLWAVIGCVVIAGANLLSQRAARSLERREATIEDLEKQLRQARHLIRKGMQARTTLQTYEVRSLPSQSNLANSRYRDWLHHWLLKADVTDHQVSFQSAQRVPDVYDKYMFSVVCQVELDQWVQLLYEFYRVDHLHRIKTMSVTPLKNGRLSLGLSIEALSLPGAEANKELQEEPSQRLAFGDVSEYLSRILGRNPYSPANQPPRFASDETQEAYVGRPASLQISAKDPEGQTVHYRLVGELPGDYHLDEVSGELRWTPPQKGEFEVTVVAEDEGVPPKREETRLKIVVTDPPPEEPRESGFDVAQFTFVTAIVAVDGKPQVWLHNRPEGRLLKLHEGDQFEAGSFRGKIVRIENGAVEIRTGDQTLRMRPGQHLREAEPVSREKVAANPSD